MDFTLSTTGVTLLTALFGGAGATLLWEGILRPKRDRRNVAEVLSAELSHNLQMLAAAAVNARPDSVPPDFALSTMVFDAVADKIGELPSGTIGEVVFVYRYFQQLNALPLAYGSSVDRLRETPEDAKHYQQLRREVQSIIDVYNSYVDKCIDRVNIVQPMLLKAAFPVWSLRGWTRKKSRTLEMREMQARVANSIEHRRQHAERIRQERNRSE